MSNSDTPRCDAFYWRETGVNPYARHANEWSEFAKNLERELSDLRRQLEVEKFESTEAERMRDFYEKLSDEIRAKLAISEASNKELREALDKLANHCLTWDGNEIMRLQAEEAKAVLAKQDTGKEQE